MTESKISQLLSEMAHPVAGAEYYAVTLTANEAGRTGWAVQSSWVGFTESNPRRELRVASLVDPGIMARLWTDLGQTHVVVGNAKHLFVFIAFLGGNALVEKSVAEE